MNQKVIFVSVAYKINETATLSDSHEYLNYEKIISFFLRSLPFYRIYIL